VLPRRPGARFALEAVFLVLLALGAGLADLRPLYIVFVMVGAWALVALAELSAGRIERAPLSYLLPLPTAEDDEEAQEVFGPRPEERTIVAPPEQAVAEEEEPPPSEPPPEQEAAGLPDSPAREEVEPPPLLPHPGPTGWVEPLDEAPPVAAETEAPEPRRPRRLRGLLRRPEPEVEPEPAPPPRHVRLLPRRPAEEPSRASREVAEVFGATSENDESAEPEESTK
jgi:hypothetical protein